MKLAVALQGVQRLYLDTAPVIYHVEGHVQLQAVVSAVFQHIELGSLTGVSGPVTLAECLVQPYQVGDFSLVQRYHDLLLTTTNMEFKALDVAAARGAELRSKYGFRLPDALQLATALAGLCDAFLTNDHSLKRVTEIPILVLDDLTL